MSENDPVMFEIWPASIRGSAQVAVVLVQAITDGPLPTPLPRADTSGAFPWTMVRLEFIGLAHPGNFATPAAPACWEAISPKRARVQIDAHRLVRSRGRHPVIALLAAGEVIGRCHFVDQVPVPFVRREPGTGFFDVCYSPDLYDLIVSTLNGKREPVWISEELGIEGSGPGRVLGNDSPAVPG